MSAKFKEGDLVYYKKKNTYAKGVIVSREHFVDYGRCVKTFVYRVKNKVTREYREHLLFTAREIKNILNKENKCL